MRLYTYAIASDVGLLTPAFVACCTTAGEGLVKLTMCNDVPGCVAEGHTLRITTSECTNDCKHGP